MTPRHKPRGRHPQHRLTAVSVRAKGPGRHADGNGLYLVVDPSGARRWIWRGVIQGKRCGLGLGGTAVVSLADARTEATAIRQAARAGGDPRRDRRQARKIVPTFEAATKTVHTAHGPTFKSAKSHEQWLNAFTTHIFPGLGAQPVDQVTSADVLRVLSPIWLKTPATASRLKQRIKLVFDWAKASGFVSGDNPTEGLTKVLPKHRTAKEHHAALSYPALPAFLATLRATPAVAASVRRGLELLVLTAVRTSEVRFGTWDEINFDTATWTIPAARMKASRDHQIPLAPRVLALLQEAYAERGDSPWICSRPDAPQKPLPDRIFLDTAKALSSTSITVHGFRSSFRDWSAEKTNAPRDVCEAALAHTLGDKTETAYKRTDLFERRRELMTAWAHFATSTPAVVVPIRA